MLAKGFADDEAIEAGQQEIEEDQVWSEGDCFLDGIDAVGGGRDGKTVAFEIEAQKAKKVFVVVNQQYFLSHTQAGQPRRRLIKEQKQYRLGEIPNPKHQIPRKLQDSNTKAQEGGGRENALNGFKGSLAEHWTSRYSPTVCRMEFCATWVGWTLDGDGMVP